jgi:hypothetical protein
MSIYKSKRYMISALCVAKFVIILGFRYIKSNMLFVINLLLKSALAGLLFWLKRRLIWLLIKFTLLKLINAPLRLKSLLSLSLMLAIMLFELSFIIQAIHAMLLATSPLLVNEINELILNKLFSISIRRLMIRRKYYKVMRYRLIGIVI